MVAHSPVGRDLVRGGGEEGRGACRQRRLPAPVTMRGTIINRPGTTLGGAAVGGGEEGGGLGGGGGGERGVEDGGLD